MPWLHGWRMSVWSCIRTRHAWCTAGTPTGVTIMRLRRSRSWATRSVPDWPKPGGGSISLTSSPRSARTRSRRWGGRYGPGTSLGAVTSPSPTWHGWSTASCTVGSTTTAASTSRCCIPSCGASTIIWCAGPAGNTNGCADANGKRNSSWPASRDASQVCSRTGASASNLMAGRWEPCKPRGFRTVLRAAGGAIPPADSPRHRRDRREGARRSAARPGGRRLGPDGATAVCGEDPRGPARRGLRLPRLHHPQDAQARKREVLRLHRAVDQGDRLDQSTGAGQDLQSDPAPRPRISDGLPGAGAAWLGELLPPRCLQADLQRDRLLHLGADHVLAAQEAPHRMARTAAQVLPARHLAPGPRRATVSWRRQRHGDQIPLPRIPHPDPVDTLSRQSLTSSLTWRARCGENRTPGSAGGPGKRNGGNAVTAPRADPTGRTPARGGAPASPPASSTFPPAGGRGCSTSSRAAPETPTPAGFSTVSSSGGTGSPSPRWTRSAGTRPPCP